MPVAIQTKPVPYCPECGGQMALRRPKPHQDFEPFWGCTDYPRCKGTRDIDSDGKPVFDEIGDDYDQ
jgi:ssDNA-binding Zn-finger/Zn-ribbon topoisomerase 1